jgi:aminoglycoside phosphotransferase (APT) family kinase protein
MLVSYEAIVDYLLTQELIVPDNIVSNELIVADASRRNCNVFISREAGPSYFLKQETRDRVGADKKVGSIAYEAEIYRLLQSIQGNETFLPYLPRCYGYDAQQRILILEGIPGSISLAEYQYRHGRAYVQLGANLGKALATLHKITTVNRERFAQLPGIPTNPPWVFFFDQPHYWIYINSSAANLEFVRILQHSTELCNCLVGLRHEWQPESLIHGDLKWDNCLLNLGPASRPAPGIQMVDWELAQIGDPSWDVGAIFSGYLAFWLSSIPISGEATPDQFLELARFPLRKIQPAIRAFWNAYIAELEIAIHETADRIMRATQYAGLRMVQTAYERLQNEASITPLDIYAIQLCENIVLRPMEAAVHLLGLPFPE